MVRETQLHPEYLIYPMFVQETSDKPEPFNAMPGQMRHTIDSLVAACEKTAESGVKAVILFGIPGKKDEAGTGAYAEDGIVQRRRRPDPHLPRGGSGQLAARGKVAWGVISLAVI